MDLSIVIPAHCEGHKIGRDVEAAAAFLVRQGLKGEIIVVDDGSSDETAQAAERAAVPPGVERRVIRYTPHRGKGCAIRTGMREARGDYAMFADSGLCVPYENALRGLDLIRRGECDIAHGSRKLPESVIRRAQPLHRRILSRLFRTLLFTLVGIPRDLTDTQCGFKIYRGDVARELYSACGADGFMFDVEVLLRAGRKGYRVREFPVEWRCDLDSRLKPARNCFRTLAELVHIKRAIGKEP
ncbi:MAG: glycosyltransferase [Phycisphaerae bacterium]